MIRIPRGGFAATSLCLLLAACGGGGDGATSTPPTELPASVSIQSTAQVETGASADFATSLTATDGVTFAWTFGDGTTGTGATASHAYPRAGTYPVTVSVSNAAGDKRTASFDVTVAASSNVHGLACTGAGEAGWCWQNTNITPHAIVQIDFLPASSKGWAVGRYGTILATTDGGDTWTPDNSGVTGDLVDVRFADEDNGIALGNVGFLVKTADAGKTWTRIALAGMTSTTPTIAAFDDTQIVVTSEDKTLASHDGGATWSASALSKAFVAGKDCWSVTAHEVQKQAGCQGAPVTYLPSENPDGEITFTGWSFHGQTRVMIMGKSYHPPTGITEQFVWTTATAGTHWVRTSSNLGADALDVHMVDYTRAYAFDTSGAVWATSDVGVTWLPVSLPADMAAATNPLQGVLGATSKLWMATSKRMAMTLDGATWQEIDAPEAASADFDTPLPRVIRWSDESNIVASRGATTYVTHDGGLNWKRVMGPDALDANMEHSAIAFSDAHHGVMAMSNGVIETTSDGGRTWNRTDHGSEWTHSWPVTLKFVSATEAWLTVDGRLMHSTDGGTTWTTPSLPDTMSGLITMYWLDATHGWVTNSIVGLGYPGTSVFATSDGGASWTRVTLPAGTLAVQSIAFSDAKTGLLQTDTVTLRTTDGGATWQKQPAGPYAWRVVHPGAHTYWRFGEDVERSVDDGATWETLDLPASQLFYDVTAADDEHVILLGRTHEANGWSPALLATTDGGATWTQEPLPADIVITSIFAYDSLTAWGVTSNGEVIATATGGR